MHTRSRHLPAEIVIFVATLIAACMSHSERDSRFHFQFDIYPGAIYLALLSWPAFLRGGDAAEDGPDVQLAAYSGPAYTMVSGLKFTQRGGTDLSFGEIAWKGQPFKPPIYYGLRAVLWPANDQQGVMVDFTHIKAKAVMERAVDQSGTRDGMPVPSREQLSTTFSKLQFTHGYNLLTLNLVRRRALGSERLLAYAGAGAGIAVPHVEVARTGFAPTMRTSEYQLAGLAVQVLGGIEWRLSAHVSLFIEYKLSCSAIRGAVKKGGVETNLCTHQLLGGPAWHLKARATTPATP
jgi:hypothetical protein